MGQAGVRLFIDECLSARLAEWLNASGNHDAVHPLHTGRRGESDHTILARCIEEDRVNVTLNAQDFRYLVGREPIHPGLVILPPVGREEGHRLLLTGSEYLSSRGQAMDVMVNHVLEIEADGKSRLHALPKLG